METSDLSNTTHEKKKNTIFVKHHRLMCQIDFPHFVWKNADDSFAERWYLVLLNHQSKVWIYSV